jgi:hypothetical protein
MPSFVLFAIVVGMIGIHLFSFLKKNLERRKIRPFSGHQLIWIYRTDHKEKIVSCEGQWQPFWSIYTIADDVLFTRDAKTELRRLTTSTS